MNTTGPSRAAAAGARRPSLAVPLGQSGASFGQAMTTAAQWLWLQASGGFRALPQPVVMAGWVTCAAGLLALAVARLDTPLVLGALLLLAGGVMMLVRPVTATVLTAFFLYVNLPAILTKRHGMPDAVAGAFILLLAFPLLHHLFLRRERPRADVAWTLMNLLLVAMLLSAVLSKDPGLALDRVLTYVFEGLVLFWLIVNAVRDLKSLRMVIGTLLAAGSLLAALSLYQEVTGSYKQEFGGLAYRNYVDEDDSNPELARLLRAQGWARAHGPVDEPNRFAQILIVLVPLGMFSSRAALTRRSRHLAAMATLLIMGGVVLTLSRGAFLALAVLAVAFVCLQWVRTSRVIAGVCVLLMVSPLLTSRFLPRLQSLTEVGGLFGSNPSSREVDGAVRGRATEMLAAFQAFLDHPIIGVGPGLYTPLYSVEYQQKNPNLKFRDLRVPRRAHMLYAETAAELGALGLSLFLAVVLVIARQLWKARLRWLQTRPDLADLATGFLLSIAAYLTTALTMHLSYQRYYWLLIALAAAAVHIMRGQATPGLEEAFRESAGSPTPSTSR